MLVTAAVGLADALRWCCLSRTRRPWGKHPRLQLLTIAELLDGKQIDCPPLRQTDRTFKKAPKAVVSGHVQPSLDLGE